MLEVTVTVDTPGHMAESVKESIGMAAGMYGQARVTSVREISPDTGQCAMGITARLPWDGAQRKRKG